MLCGIALLGVVTAGLASWLIDRVRDVEEEPQLATRRDLEDLTAEVRALRDALAASDNANISAPRQVPPSNTRTLDLPPRTLPSRPQERRD